LGHHLGVAGMKRSVQLLTVSATALALFAFSHEASADTVTAQDTGTAPFSVFNVGTSSSSGFKNRNTITSPGFDDITSITFSGSGTGVYAGSTSGVADSPFTLGTFSATACSPNCPEYFAVLPGGTVTVTFSSAQTTLDMLWGTVDTATGYNLVTDGGTQITGAQINALLGNPSSGTVNAAVEVTGLPAFTTLTFQDTTGNDPAFEFDLGATATPLPATLPLFAGGLGLVGYLTKRRKQSAKQTLTAS
jgi:hypothetical protein